MTSSDTDFLKWILSVYSSLSSEISGPSTWLLHTVNFSNVFVRVYTEYLSQVIRKLISVLYQHVFFSDFFCA